MDDVGSIYTVAAHKDSSTMDPNTNNPAPNSPDNPQPEVFQPTSSSATPEQSSPGPAVTPPQTDGGPQIITPDQPSSSAAPAAASAPAVAGAPSPGQQPLDTTPPPPVVVSGGFNGGTPSTPTVGGGTPTSQPASISPSTPPNAMPPTGSKNRRRKPFFIGLAAVLVLAIGSAAAYVGIVLPNEPINVLKQAMVNSLEQTQVNFTGTLHAASTDGSSSIPSVDVSLSGAENATAKTSDITLGVGVEGIKLSVEALLANQNLYLKTGDLSTLAGFIGAADPSAASLVNTVSQTLSNQWIEVDKALLEQANLSCILNTSFTVNQADINLITSDYSKHGFLTVEKSTGVTVGNQAADEFNVNVDDNKFASFVNGLSGLSYVKSLDSCQPGAAKGLTNVKGDGQQTPITVWVAKSNKRIIQLSYTTTSAMQAKSHEQGTFTLALNYNPVTITAPTNAEPAMQVITQLEQALGGSSSDFTNLIQGFTSGLGGSSSL